MLLHNKIIFILFPLYFVKSTKTGRNAVSRAKYKQLKLQPYCDYCLSRNELTVHHIRNVDAYPRYAFNIDNLVTLCAKHHKEVHSINGGFKKPITEKEYLKFRHRRFKEIKL